MPPHCWQDASHRRNEQGIPCCLRRKRLSGIQERLSDGEIANSEDYDGSSLSTSSLSPFALTAASDDEIRGLFSTLLAEKGLGSTELQEDNLSPFGQKQLLMRPTAIVMPSCCNNASCDCSANSDFSNLLTQFWLIPNRRGGSIAQKPLDASNICPMTKIVVTL